MVSDVSKGIMELSKYILVVSSVFRVLSFIMFMPIFFYFANSSPWSFFTSSAFDGNSQ